jgi:hypothetical protein
MSMRRGDAYPRKLRQQLMTLVLGEDERKRISQISGCSGSLGRVPTQVTLLPRIARGR